MSDVASPHPAPPHAHLPIDLRWWKQAAGVVVAVPVALYLAYSATLGAWRAMVPPPPPMHVTLANGVEYIREVESNPNRVWHIVKVDLTAEGLSVEGPKLDATLALPLIATRPSKAVADNGWVLAFGVGDSYPDANEGEPTGSRAPAKSRGVGLPGVDPTFGDHDGMKKGRPDSLSFQLGAPATFSGTSSNGDTAAMMEFELVRDGKVWTSDSSERQSRLGIGLDASGKTMYIASIDGRLSKASGGVTDAELGEKLKSLGAANAGQFAHGDRVSLAAVLPGSIGPVVLNMPSHGGVPGREPALGTMLGIKAAPRL